jgi:hypothetical protein
MSFFVLLVIPLLLQGGLMVFDEIFFHQERGLPKWEILGHPLDTITVLMPLLYALLFKFNQFNIFIYILLSLFSCLFIVKDEWIHKDLCSKGEMITHALLFIVHPMVFFSIFIFWQFENQVILGSFITAKMMVILQLFLTCLFLIYQIIFCRFFYVFKHK